MRSSMTTASPPILGFGAAFLADAVPGALGTPALVVAHVTRRRPPAVAVLTLSLKLTEDHTWQNLQVQQGRLTREQARGRAGKNIITRAVGLREFVEVDILVRLLLCSDGLHAYLDSGAILSDLFKLDIREAARAAIRHANACGGADNITALFVEFLASS